MVQLTTMWGRLLQRLVGRRRRCQSHGDNIDVLSVGRQCFEILGVRRDDGPSWFGRGDNERVNRRATTRAPAQKGSATGERFRDGRRDVTGLEKLVLKGVATGVTLKTLNEDDGRYLRGPQSCLAQGQDQGQRLLGTFGKSGHSAGVEY